MLVLERIEFDGFTHCMDDNTNRGIAQEVCAKMWITPGEILSQRLMELPEPERCVVVGIRTNEWKRESVLHRLAGSLTHAYTHSSYCRRHRHARARALFDEQMEEGRGLLKDVPAFRIFDGGRTPAFMLVYREGRGFLRATNAAYEKLTSGLSEEYDQAMTGQALPSLIMTWCVRLCGSGLVGWVRFDGSTLPLSSPHHPSIHPTPTHPTAKSPPRTSTSSSSTSSASCSPSTVRPPPSSSRQAPPPPRNPCLCPLFGWMQGEP